MNFDEAGFKMYVTGGWCRVHYTGRENTTDEDCY